MDSMKQSETLPFDRNKLFRLMAGERLDLLLISSRHNLRYLTGGYFYPLYVWDSHTKGTQYLSFMGIPPGSLDKAFYVGRPGEPALVRERRLWMENLHQSDSISTRAGALKTVQVIREAFTGLRRIGIEWACLPADAWVILKEAMPDVEFVDAAPLMDSLRAVKTAEEIALFREGTLRNLKGVETVMKAGREGITTAAMASALEQEFRALGVHFLYSLICAGPSYFRFPSPDYTWRRGEVLHIDTGCLLEGYVQETCRMACLGEPSREAQKMMEGCVEMRDEVLKVLNPSLTSRGLQQAGNDFLAAHPLGSSGKFIAHGIGLVHHEDPGVNLDSEKPLEAGMILSLEMEFRQKEVGHVKIEEMVLITEGGSEILSPGGGEWTIAAQ